MEVSPMYLILMYLGSTMMLATVASQAAGDHADDAVSGVQLFRDPKNSCILMEADLELHVGTTSLRPMGTTSTVQCNGPNGIQTESIKFQGGWTIVFEFKSNGKPAKYGISKFTLENRIARYEKTYLGAKTPLGLSYSSNTPLKLVFAVGKYLIIKSLQFRAFYSGNRTDFSEADEDVTIQQSKDDSKATDGESESKDEASEVKDADKPIGGGNENKEYNSADVENKNKTSGEPTGDQCETKTDWKRTTQTLYIILAILLFILVILIIICICTECRRKGYISK